MTHQAPSVVAVGHLCMDRVLVCAQFPQQGASQHVLSYALQPGGTAAQAMAVLARLGENVGYLGPIGTDQTGQALYEDCVREGVDVSRCTRVNGAHAFTDIIVNQARGTRTFVSYHSDFPAIAFSAQDEEYLASARILHLDNTQNEDALAAARIARRHGVLVSLDGASVNKLDNEKNWELVCMTDVLIACEEFPQKLTGMDDLPQALQCIAARAHPKILLCTRGERGCLLVTQAGITAYPAYSIRAVDTTGAGDVFHGAFLYGLLHGYSVENNIRFASAAAALSCLRVGGRAGIPSFSQIEEFLRVQPFA